MKTIFRKTILVSFLLMAVLGQVRLSAQGDNFFYISDDLDGSYDNAISFGATGSYGMESKDGGGNSMGANMIFGEGIVQDNETKEHLPLGNGLAVLVMAGAGYIAIKKRKNIEK